jgi:hypothetical protein
MVAVGSSACATAANVGRQVVNLLTVLVADDGATGGPRVSSECNAILSEKRMLKSAGDARVPISRTS